MHNMEDEIRKKIWANLKLAISDAREGNISFIKKEFGIADVKEIASIKSDSLIELYRKTENYVNKRMI